MRINNIINYIRDIMRILLTDILFPNKFAKWRLVEIHSFMEKYDTDILVINRINKYCGLDLNFDYEYLSTLFNLKDYNILIFDPKYNFINKYNINFNGIKYNNKIKSCYLIRNKKFGECDFDINSYDKIYHIFLMNYYSFNKIFNFSHNKQYVHLYPGGGLINKTSLIDINRETKLIPTQYFIYEYLLNLNKTNKILNMYGAPLLYKNEIINKKHKLNEVLTICFTSLGDIVEKGADTYVKLVNLFYLKYPNLKVKFISIGICPNSSNIVKLQPMEQDLLSKYYFNNVDIVLNLDSGKSLNGFPLGCEAIMEGCLLLTTDIHNSNENNKFYLDNFIIIDRNNIEDIINKIVYLESNRNILLEKSIKLQNRIYELFCYKNQMEKIFNFIEE